MLITESNQVEAKKTVCNLIIIDASGSMYDKIDQVRKGIREILGDIRNDQTLNQHTIICDFATDFRVLVNSDRIEDLNDSIADEYKPRGSTALRDAIGQGFSLVPQGMTGVFVNIITDGEENASKEYTSEAIEKLIAEKKEQKWGITFQGTTQEAVLTAQSWGIAASNTQVYHDSALGMTKSIKSRGLARQMYNHSVSYCSDTSGIQVDNLMGNGNDLTTTGTADMVHTVDVITNMVLAKDKEELKNTIIKKGKSF